jgi:hypothetical protein
MGGYFFHGYFSYTPLFFFHLAEANRYEILYRYYWKAPGDAGAAAAPDEMTAHGWPETWCQDWGIEFIFRKTGPEPFRIPVEIGTSARLDETFVAEKGAEFQMIAGTQGNAAEDR